MNVGLRVATAVSLAIATSGLLVEANPFPFDRLAQGGPPTGSTVPADPNDRRAAPHHPDSVLFSPKKSDKRLVAPARETLPTGNRSRAAQLFPAPTPQPLTHPWPGGPRPSR